MINEKMYNKINLSNSYIIFFICGMLFSGTLTGQNLGFNYQAVARDAGGNLLENQNVNARIQIRRSSTNGQVIYEETHEIQTNEYGLFNFVIGTGNAINGNFQTITWGGDVHFVRVFVNNENLGTNRFEAVPYSKVATDMFIRQLQDVSNNAPTQNQLLVWNGSAWEPRSINIETVNYSAGEGISINGNTITNTGDTNPEDDLTVTSEAGGDVRGTFDNLRLGNNTVGSNQIVNGSIKIEDLEANISLPSGPPSGTAGGDLGGSFPNPIVIGLQDRPLDEKAPQVDQALIWDGNQWTPQDISDNGGSPSGNAGGDLSGTYPNPRVSGLQNNPVSNQAPQQNQVLTWNGNLWLPANIPNNGGGDPSGPAGGDLGGTYPNPSVTGIQNIPVDISSLQDGEVLIYDNNIEAFVNSDISSEVAPQIFNVAQTYTSNPKLNNDAFSTLASVRINTEEEGCVVISASGKAVLEEEGGLLTLSIASLIFGIDIQGNRNNVNQNATTLYLPNGSSNNGVEAVSVPLSISRVFEISGNTTFNFYARQSGGNNPILIDHINLIAQFYPDYYSICSK